MALLKPLVYALCGPSLSTPPSIPLPSSVRSCTQNHMQKHLQTSQQLLLDSERQLNFPNQTVNVLVLDESTRPLIPLELMVPWEYCLEEAFGRERARCLLIGDTIRGIVAQSLSRASRSMVIDGKRKRRAISKTTKESLEGTLAQERRSMGI